MSELTKRGYKYNRGGIPINGRKSHDGYRDMFEDRKRSRKKSLERLWELQHKRDCHLNHPNDFQPLSETQAKILENMEKNMVTCEEFEEKTDEFRTLCIGQSGSHERGRKMKYLMSGKEITHPQDSTFKKRVKILSDRGREVLERKRKKKMVVQAIA